MKYIQAVLLLLMIGIATGLQAGTLSASTDRAQLNRSETLTLTLQYDSSANDEPDTSELEQQFTITGQHKSTSIQIVNGDASRSTVWYYELSPKKSGKLLIPSFHIDGDFSEAIAIDVDEKSTGATQGRDNIYTEAALDKDQVYVQQQAIISWRLIARTSFSQVKFLPPSIDGALVQDLGSRTYQRTGSDGTTERVVEQRYAVFPQKSGTITIPSQQFQVAVETNRRTSNGFFLSGNPQIFALNTEEKNLTATPADKTKSAAWLPASALDISQEILGTTQGSQVTAGTAFTRVIRIRTEGLTAEQIPPPDMQAAGIKVYSEPPELNNKASQQGVVGMREDRAAIIATQAGSLTLPAITIPWYDVDAAQWREAVLPESTLTVLPGAATLPNTAASTTVSNTAPPSAATQSPLQASPFPWWPVISALLALLLLAVMAFLFRLQRQGKQPTQDNKARASSTSISTQPGVGHVSAALRHATERGNPEALHQALMAWTMENPALSAAMHHPSIAPLIQSLERHLYGNGPAPSSNDLQNLAQELEKLAANQTPDKKKAQLESLYC